MFIRCVPHSANIFCFLLTAKLVKCLKQNLLCLSHHTSWPSIVESHVFSLLWFSLFLAKGKKGFCHSIKEKKGRSKVCKPLNQGILSHWQLSYALPPRHKIPIMVGLNSRKQYNHESKVLSFRFTHSLPLFFESPFFLFATEFICKKSSSLANSTVLVLFRTHIQFSFLKLRHSSLSSSFV